MKLNFRQGIVKHQKSGDFQTFLQQDGNTVSLLTDNKEFVYTISHNQRDYLFIQTSNVPNAWTINTSVNCWLTIEISQSTGQPSYVTEYKAPIISATAPPSPSTNDVWFDTTSMVYKKFDSSKFVALLKLYVGIYTPGGITSNAVTQEYTGSAVGVTGVFTTPGFFMYTDNGTLLKRQDGTFVTTEDYISTTAANSSFVKLGSVGFTGTALSFLPAYHMVTLDNSGRIRITVPTDFRRFVYGIIEQNVEPGELVRVSTEGFFENSSWNWSTPNAKLYLDGSGGLTETPSINQLPVAIAINNHAILLKNGEMHVYKEDKGEKGDIGPTGPKGEVGPMGSLGATGFKGQKGEIGDIGPQGIKGDFGDKGDRGPTGITGSPGFKGDKGDTGQKGDFGGQKGDKGDAGAAGTNGVKGDKGDLGQKGDPGGQKGDKGDIGPNGSMGVKGDKGDIGTAGTNGTNGINGSKGDKGDNGEVGPQGIQGIQGIQGLTGLTGPTGLKGDKGQKGDLGPTGVKGDIGPNGALVTILASTVTLTSANYGHFLISNSVTITLPLISTVSTGHMFRFFKTRAVTPVINAQGANNILTNNGDLTSVSFGVNSEMVLISDGTSWIMIHAMGEWDN